MRAAVRQVALEQILDQFLHFEITQRVVRFDRVTTNTFCNHVFAQTERRTAFTRALEIIDHFTHELRAIGHV